MGSSGWEYFVTYQSDINKALQELRQQVYDDGDYYKDEVKYEYKKMTEEEIHKQYGGHELSDIIIHDILQDRSLPEPTDPDSLITWNGHDGTHSIIDITKVSSHPDFGTASPLTDDELINLFGTMKPTHAQVQEKKQALFELRGRWMGMYIIIYKDDEPSEIFFKGHSGD